MRPAASGDAIRLQLANVFSPLPLPITAVSVGTVARGAAVVDDSLHRVTFRRRAGVSVPAWGTVTSDSVGTVVHAGARLAITISLPHATDLPAAHYLGLQTSYCGRGNHAMDESGDGLKEPTQHVAVLTRLDVLSDWGGGTIVALGDSITDGFGAETGKAETWVDVLNGRLAHVPAVHRPVVVNAGIAGNTVAAPYFGAGPPASDRLQRDVLNVPGVRAVILFEGTNDILMGAGAPAVITGLQDIIRRLHARHLRVLGATLLPRHGGWGGNDSSHDAARDAVNRWLRTDHHVDTLLDFDRLLRDPRHSEMLQPRYDLGDHTHPNVAGYRVLGNSIPLSALTSR